MKTSSSAPSCGVELASLQLVKSHQTAPSQVDSIRLLGGSAVVWPFAARAQQAMLRTISFLGAAGSAVATRRLAAFVQRLRELGWSEGRNVAFEVWAKIGLYLYIAQAVTGAAIGFAIAFGHLIPS